jgi:hypothetical protein
MAILLSIHAPKAGGSSVRRILASVYGEGMRLDYADNPASPVGQRLLDPSRYMDRTERIPDGVSCVHGHFHPGKYEISAHDIIFTMLRNPIDNIISIYYFWKSMPRQGDVLHDYFVDHNLSLLETAKLPILRYLYSRTYFGDFPMDRFDLIGRHEDRQAALLKLAQLIGRPLDVSVRDNVTPPSDERAEMENDPVLRGRLADILADDMRFYERHVTR